VSLLFLDPAPKGLIGTGAGGSSSIARTGSQADPSDTQGGSGAGGDTSANAPPSYSVTSVSWAPSCGRSYHLIATGGRDGRVRIWKIKPGDELDKDEEDAEDGQGQDADDGKWSASLVADFDSHK
jgi:nucleoporin SEH1